MNVCRSERDKRFSHRQNCVIKCESYSCMQPESTKAVRGHQARGPGFESGWEHSSFSLKSPDFVPVATRIAFSGIGQARIENNLFIYLSSLL